MWEGRVGERGRRLDAIIPTHNPNSGTKIREGTGGRVQQKLQTSSRGRTVDRTLAWLSVMVSDYQPGKEIHSHLAPEPQLRNN